MLILTLRTDKPEAELGLYDGTNRLAYTSWLAHRQLAETIQQTIEELFNQQQKTLPELQGIVAYQGPGSFTGLRIGLSVANALAYSYRLPIVAAGGETWIDLGIQRLLQGQSDSLALPEYGSEPHITQARK